MSEPNEELLRKYISQMRDALACAAACADLKESPGLHNISLWKDLAYKDGVYQWISSSPAVPPAMQRALGEGEYNTIGDELRKIDAAIQNFYNGLDNRLVGVHERLQRIEQNQQLIMQKLEIGENEYGAEFTQLKCLLDLTNKRLKALELADRRARKRQPKPVRRKKRRK